MLTRNREQQKYVILAAAWLIYFCNIGVITYGVSAITAPMIEELKFPIGVAVALCTAMQGLCGPVVGEIVSRSGSKTALLLGNMILAVAFFIIGCVPLTGARFTVLYGIFVGAGMGFAGNVGVQSLINSWFTERKALAMAIALSSGGVGGFAAPLFLRSVIARFSWRAAWCSIGVLNALLTIITAVFVVSRPDAIHDTREAGSTEEGLTVKPGELLSLKSFRLIMINYVSRTAIYYSFSGFAVLFLISRAVPYERAVTVMSIVSLVSLFARLMTGMVSGRLITSNMAVGLGNIGMAAGVGILAALAPNIGGIYAGAVVFGIGVGLVNVALPLTFAFFYGERNFPIVSGYATPPNYLIGAIAPLLLGELEMNEWGYTVVFLLIAAFSFVGGMAAIIARPEPRFADKVRKKQRT